MVESTQCDRYGTEPLKALARAGVPVVLGSGHSGMWGDGEGTSMHEQERASSLCWRHPRLACPCVSACALPLLESRYGTCGAKVPRGTDDTCSHAWRASHPGGAGARDGSEARRGG
eukprot:139315-Prymnesium_polylepis.2